MRKQIRITPDTILDEKIGKLQRRREWWYLLVECAVIAAVLYILLQYVAGITFVSGISMEPFLPDGELVVFYRLDREYQKDDVVLIRRAGNVEYIKRVAGCEGDEILLEEDGSLWRNGRQEKANSWTGRTEALSEKVTYPYAVPEDSYFVLGDNREHSIDSREFGAVKEEEIVGRVIVHLGLTR